MFTVQRTVQRDFAVKGSSLYKVKVQLRRYIKMDKKTFTKTGDIDGRSRVGRTE